jgi:hypothetical protein
MAAIELEIILEGEAPGLAAHRLSLAAFSKPLNLLLRAYRRIASGLLRDALDDPAYGGRGGKYAEAARKLDFEIARVGQGSLILNVICTTDVGAGATYPLFQNGLMEQAGTALLDSINAESQHHARNWAVRKYLAALPIGLHRQSYKLRQDGRELKAISIAHVSLPEVPPAIPYLDEIEGLVVGVGFDPGPYEVKLQGGDNGPAATYAATKELVEKALTLRHAPVRAIVVRGAAPKLLLIEGAAEIGPESRAADIADQVMTRWDSLLRRLA